MPRRKTITPWMQLLAQARRDGQRIEDLPARLVREALKKDMPGTRSILLPPPR